LPKGLRTSLVPAPQVASRVAGALVFGEGRLLDALGAEIERQTGVAIPADAWRTDALPAHLRMNLRVVGEKGAEVAQGRDVADLRRRMRKQIDDGVARLAADALSRDGATGWAFGDLPEHIDVPRAGVTVRIYPALLDMGATVSLRGMPSSDAAARATRAGLRRLFVLRLRQDFRHSVERLPGVERLRLHWSTLGKSAELHDALDCVISELTFLSERGPVRTKKEFQARLDEGWNRFGAVASDVVRLVDDILSRRQQAVLAIESLRESAPGAPGAKRDVQEQMSRLFTPGFLVTTPVEWLAQFPRYMEAVALRLRKLSAGGAAREAKGQAQVGPLAQRIGDRLDRAGAEGSPPDAALSNCRWLLEELRVSLFAQELGTAVPVSVKRVEQEWAGVRS
jgi:ATP-dependent helicase HrpA